jgi:hypothetical protein
MAESRGGLWSRQNTSAPPCHPVTAAPETPLPLIKRLFALALVQSLLDDTFNGRVPQRRIVSPQILVMGYAIGSALADIFTNSPSRPGSETDLLSTLTAMFNRWRPSPCYCSRLDSASAC